MNSAAATGLHERIERLLPRIVCRKPCGTAEKHEVYGLRYRSYLREGAIRSDASGRLTDRFDDTPNGHTLGIYLDGKLAGSVRIHVVSRHGDTQSPATEAFHDVLSPAVDRGDVIVDPNRLVVDHAASRAQPDLHYVVLRVPFVAAAHFGADLVTATVRSEHQAFYRRILRFETAADARAYPTLLKPLGLMTARFRHDADGVQRRFPFFAPRPGEGAALFGPVQTVARDSATDDPHPQRNQSMET